jgi:Zn-finger nucleic acid-binding protein
MDCPRCHVATEPVSIQSIRLDRCPRCGGTWYDAGELRLLKDRAADGDYRWIDFDLWRDTDKFRAGEQEGLACPKDGTTMTTVRYGESDVLINICLECRGVWLDAGEFRRIVEYLDEMVNSQDLGDYLEDVRDEFLDVVRGREGVQSELADIGKVLYLLQLRFAVQYQRLVDTLRRIARGVPGT